MTFRFLAPWLAWLLIAAAAVAAGVLFALRPRPPRRVVSSLLVWQRVLDAAPARAWRDRVRWLLSLVLSIAMAVVLAAAFARPAPAAGDSSARRLIVLDSSWTMGARTPSRGTRWSIAVERARQLADAWHGDIAIATTADGVIEGPTPDKALVWRALSRLQPTGADGAWPQVSGASDVHFLTDGALARPVPSDVIVHSVFTPAPNVAISAFEVEPGRGTSGTATVFLAVANHAEAAQVVRIGISRGSDALVDTTVQLDAGALHREVLTVGTPGAARFHAHLSAADNDLAIDDDAAAWLWAAEPLRVTVVGTSSPLPALLARDPTLLVTAIDPAGYPGATADVWIFDGWTPAEAPARPALLIDPPPARWLGPRGPDEPRPTWSRAIAHPLLEGVDTALLEIERARAIVAPLLQPIALSAEGTPLLAIEERGTNRRVALAFSLGESNLAATPAFPVLVGNILDWLGRPQRDLNRQAGPIVLPASTARVVAPDGRSLPIARFDDRVTASLDRPGLYLVQSPGGQSVVRVTIGDTRRSNLLVSSLEAAPAVADVSKRGSRPWWVALAAAAFALAALEWATWQRRITI